MRSPFYSFGLCCLLAIALAGVLGVAPVQAEPREVRVGGYLFPPFAEQNADGEWFGLTVDLITQLNAAQQNYRFVFLPTSATRRYHDFDNERFDLMFFESPHWGWQDRHVVSLLGPPVGGEVFVAQSRPGRDQSYFADREDKRVAVFSGYHYHFADYNPSKQYLRREHNAIITFSQESSLQMLLRERVELAVIPQAFLERYLNENPQYRSQLLIASEPDQYYRHILIKRKLSEPKLAYMTQLLDRLEEEGKMQRLLVRYGLLGSN
ncbi:ABC transporter substrate-binding protein [uncultured Halopseudomonas sp.]|uniref:substrate-binding periplasmic protein n=1 Tax=uncultured Halopseudomonas sp. TaxID=2901193 RepID=UPI0030EE54BB|tara:strand:- start:11994 stop:12788 length:795 start_codon:yes stop_codon:yes gene_type:complete